MQKPGSIHCLTQNSKIFQRPLPINKLTVGNAVVYEEKNEVFLKPHKLYESCVVKLLKTDEIVEKEVDKPIFLPLEDDEIQNDEAINVALNKNFVKVPKTEEKVKISKKKFKNTENFVRTNLSRSKSNKKLGKTMCPKRKFRYFTRENPETEESNQLMYSAGYTQKIRTQETSPTQILEKEFCFESFRQGQLESILDVLANRNVISVLPTGTGKSLIYQMCARILGGLCIVISPLLSLITDQLLRLPNNLSGSALTSNVSLYSKILSQAKSGVFDILFVTPEKFLSESIHTLPNISLICIDEAHCMSKLSNSSRLSYMLIPKLISHQRILALTAAIDCIGLSDLKTILKIDSVISHGPALRPNLNVTVSREDDTLTAVGKIIHTNRFKTGSIIIYCPMQYLADSVAQWLRSKGESCMSYHSGIGNYRRNKVQEDFITGKIRIIVATVAFGMGIDKTNINGVIHLSLPYSLEHFIQGSGRAGRNGLEANVHVFINEKSLNYSRALIYSSHVTKKHVVMLIKLLRPKTLKRARDQPRPEGPVLYKIIGEMTEELGLDKERILSLFYYLESKNVISSVFVCPVTLNVSFHKTQPDVLAEKYAIISQILTTGKKLAQSRRVHLPELCEKINLTIEEVIKVVKRLSATGEIFAEFNDEAFVITAGNLPEELELLSLAKETEEYFSSIEEVFRKKIETCFMILDRVAKDSFGQCEDCNGELGGLIEEYLHKSFYDEIPEEELRDISLDIHSLASEIDGIPEPKDICCILQGINTVRTPGTRWKNSYLWGRYNRFKFLQVYNQCCEVLLEDLNKKVVFKENLYEDEVIEN